MGCSINVLEICTGNHALGGNSTVTERGSIE